MEPDLEKDLKEICTDLYVKLRGNGGGNGNALIDHGLIQHLHTTLDAYKESIHKEEMVSKELVWSLFYTCSRFYIQSKYSRNAVDLMREFDKLNYKLLRTFDNYDN
ncbi:hypothetical protein A3842_06470 [Paenibacillus sp. P3E]|uniref:hypothetical protein n=1 Tax=unclassified Paenibacillus TaxID=185978 RepID=UPI00093BCA63|nr:MULTISPECIES: hypothetical protein [unclassified Paenibacillus]OKP86943.1 hypothetical protein A3842_06470 [Paenibacillus sp. P3E]OKP89518.1 hypothetical protein A3848_15365 [Paenibacillus sp. P32E]